VGREGIAHRVDVALNDEERASLESSARAIRTVADRFGV
jgi:malate/lactate dehydrogenase